MISSALVFSLLISVQIPAAGPRQAFASCLRTFMNEKVQEGMAVDAFEAAVAGTCTTQENAYRAAYIQAATRAGDGRAAAERDANLEVQDLRANILELFRGAQAE